MLRNLCFALIPFAAAAALLQQGKKGPDLHQQFAELAAKGDRAGIMELWKANPDSAAGTIDQDLEGFLAKIEKGGADAAEIQTMKDRAILGAKCADEAFGRTMLSDYASSFAGWNATQQKDFRQGQKLAGDARKQIKDKNYEAALKTAQDCVKITEELGDWWGLATATDAKAAALEQLGKKQEAAVAAQYARIIYHDMGMSGSEARATLQLARLLSELGSTTRARVAAESGAAAAKRAKNANVEKQFDELLQKLSQTK
jgi:hypothetical protein